jgi:multidrug resistance efflux pump
MGQPLVVLDDSIYHAEVEEVQAALELSRANYDRALAAYVSPTQPAQSGRR